MYKKVGYSIEYEDIMYFFSKNKHVYIIDKNNEGKFYYGKLIDIVLELPFQFVCLSKSVIVNVSYIESWKSNLVVMKNGKEISIAQSKRADFKKAIYDYGRNLIDYDE